MDLARQQTRRWKVGDVYAPHDLSSVEMQKWKRRIRPGDLLGLKGKRREWGDTFDALAIDPIREYKVRGVSDWGFLFFFFLEVQAWDERKVLRLIGFVAELFVDLGVLHEDGADKTF